MARFQIFLTWNNYKDLFVYKTQDIDMFWVIKFLSVRDIVSISLLLKLTKFTVKGLEDPLLLIAVSEN